MKRYLQNLLARFGRFLRKQEAAAEIHRLRRAGLLEIGRHTYGMPTLSSYAGSERKVTIGSYCSVAPGVQIITGGIHPADWVALYPFRINWNLEGALQDGMPASRGEIEIGSDVWLGTDAMILSGVKIGHGAVVAARSVVTRDVEPYSVVAGCPARRIAYRFPPEIIERLLKIAWWNWSESQVREAVPLLSSSKIESFLQRYDPAMGKSTS